MAVTITAPVASTSRGLAGRLLPLISSVIVAGLVWALASHGLVVPALLVVLVVELWPARRRLSAAAVWAQATRLVVGLSIVAMIALLPKALSQLAVAVLYAAWRLWGNRLAATAEAGLITLLAVQAVVFEALFLLAATPHAGPPRPVTLVLLWVAVYVTTYQLLAARQERAAGVLAATWALVATEAAWVFLTWLVTYISPGNYVIVPQPAIVLTALAYCFGSIYAAQRQGTLNRARLTEYLLISLILIWIVIAGTPWRGTL